jgi:hypothetical protein
MAKTAQAPATPAIDPIESWLSRRGVVDRLHAGQLDSEAQRAATSRANSLHSTGPRTESGKQRSSQNALTHGLTAASPVLASEDPAAYQLHIQQFRDEYQPATATETQLTQELADTAWRINRIPSLEAALLDRAANPPTEQARIDFDIVDAHRALASLGLHGSRLSRQFQKALEQLREIQAERRHLERRQLTEASELFLRLRHKGLPWDPADYSKEAGFVFSTEQIERHARKLVHQKPAFYATLRNFQADPPPAGPAV